VKKIIWIVAFILVCIIFIMLLSNSTQITPLRGDTSGSRLVIGDDYFITQLNDIYYNVDDYIGKTIEIEGFPLSDPSYKFVGRYGPRLLLIRRVCIYGV